MIARDDIDVVDIVTPGDTHAEIAIAALEAGKHVLCEKPLANTVAEAEAMTAAAEQRAPSAASARWWASPTGACPRRPSRATSSPRGASATIRQVRAEYLQDWLMDAEAPLTWRMQKERAGSGALGDIGAHAVDLTEYITGQKVDHASRASSRRSSRSGRCSAKASGCRAPRRPSAAQVTVDDIALFTGRLESGALASFEATRFRTGRKNALRIEISGSKGAIAFDLERLNELEFYDATLPETGLGFQRILVTEHDHPYLAPWWPTGHMLGYEHGFSHQVYDFVTAIAEGTQPLPVVRGRAARAARARRRRAQLRRGQRLDADRRLTRHRPHPADTGRTPQ